ncbi:putative Ig domain-containing protein [Pontiellaceae bacterium B12227]|nr:putative Ig domain-containing protein [Pontiellaceae bacterium B12227]
MIDHSNIMINEEASVSAVDGEVYDPVYGDGKYLLTPPELPLPRINGPSVFGVRPGSPFLYTIPASGRRPMKFRADHLPAGLQLNADTGQISGTIVDATESEYRLVFKVENRFGSAERTFTVVVGDSIGLTPPMGWNSWNCWQTEVSQKHVRDSARAMVETELINYGWSYINIDDAWQGRRGGPHNAIQPDPSAFPDLGKLCDEIHALGLKVGIYSSPWITTYAGRIGGSSDYPDGRWDQEIMGHKKDRKMKECYRVAEHVFDENDAAQWAEWGIDYLKYDWNPNDPASTLRMANALKNCGRDILYSISNTAPLEHAELYMKVVNCWRTAGDLKDRWDQEGCHLNVVEQWTQHRNWMEEGVRGGPGHFPDADMLVIGDVVTSTESRQAPAPSSLTPDEQYSHISLWVLWSCPLLIGCPIESMDAFTLNLLKNAEVLEVHQDALAVPGRSYDLANQVEVVVKELADGGKAIGLFNKADADQVVSIDWKTIGLSGPTLLRDIWRQTDIGHFRKGFSAKVRSHGVVLVRTMS